MMFVAGPPNQKFASSVTELWTGLTRTMKTSGDQFIGRGFQLKAICFINNKASSTHHSHTRTYGGQFAFPSPTPFLGKADTELVHSPAWEDQICTMAGRISGAFKVCAASSGLVGIAHRHSFSVDFGA